MVGLFQRSALHAAATSADRPACQSSGVSRSSVEMRLPLSPTDSRSLTSAVVAEEGWTLTRDDAGSLEAREDPARLHCHCPQATVEVTLEQADGDATALTVTGRVPGLGPISAKHAREQADFLARRIGLAAAASAARVG